MTSPTSRFRSSRTRSNRNDMASSWSKLNFGRNFFGGVTLDAVAGLRVIKSLNANAALHAGADFVDFILEAAQRLDDSLVNQALAAQHSRLAANHPAGHDSASGDVPALGQGKELAHFGRTDDDL